MSEPMSQAARTPPRFVPTLTEAVVPKAAQAPDEPAPPRKEDPVIAAAFAEILKDWPDLAPSTLPNPHDAVARRAEALVMQRLPGLLAGVVAQAVREALAEQDKASQINRA